MNDGNENGSMQLRTENLTKNAPKIKQTYKAHAYHNHH